MRKRRLIGVTLFLLALVPLGYLGYGQWKAERLDDWSCADQTAGVSVSFCITLPKATSGNDLGREADAAKIALLAKLKGIALQNVPTQSADLWVEDAVPPEVRTLLVRSLDADLSRIADDFGRHFAAKPKIIVFATAPGFEEGLKTLFSYDYQTARSLAQNNGGALILEAKTIAINWHQLGREKPLTILRHELTHAVEREIAGSNAVFPAWFDEGMATREQSTLLGTERAVENDLYVSSALVSSGRISLAQLTTPQDWIKQSAALQGRNYAVAATAVGILRDRIADAGLRKILDEVGKGSAFETAFAQVYGQPVGAFVAGFPSAVIAQAPDPSMTSTPAGNGDVQWQLRGLEPNSKATVTIDGPQAYHLSFPITIDPFGMYGGTFGATAPAGQYTVVVDGTKGKLTSTVTVTH